MRYYCLFLYSVVSLSICSFAEAYTVMPPVIEHTVEPRDMLEDSIKITNTDNVPIKIFPSVHPVTLGEDGSINHFETPVMTDQTRNVTSWIAVSRARIELQPGESIKVPVQLTVNPNAVPGDYYAFIGFGNGDKRDEVEAAVVAGKAPGVVMRISLSDKKNEYIRLESFTIDRYITGNSGEQVAYTLENVGEAPVTPQGEVILYDVRGREVGAVELNTERVQLAAGEKREFTYPLPQTASFGRHKAFLNLEYGEAMRANLYDTTFYTVVPVRMLIIIFGLLLLTSLLLTTWYLVRNRRNHVEQDDESVAMYIRNGVHSNIKDHDINLKHN